MRQLQDRVKRQSTETLDQIIKNLRHQEFLKNPVIQDLVSKVTDQLEAKVQDYRESLEGLEKKLRERLPKPSKKAAPLKTKAASKAKAAAKSKTVKSTAAKSSTTATSRKKRVSKKVN